MDLVAKEGTLFLQGVKFGKRIWRRTWVILFEPSPAGIGRLEMYDTREGVGINALKQAGLRKADKRVIRLADCLSITPAPGESCPTGCAAFYLNTTQRTYTLAGPKQDEWMPILCQLAFQRNEGSADSRRVQKDEVSMSDNDLYSTLNPDQYQITVMSSEESKRCRMSGKYLLSPEKEDLCLRDLKTGKIVFSWPYRFLRRFGQVKEGITIEAGRRCHTGEGHFTFLSKQGSQIYRAIEEAIMHQSVQDLLSNITSQMQDTTAQLPPPRPEKDNRLKASQDSPTRSIQNRPCPVVSRRNLALPPPPAPLPPPPPEPPALPAPPAPRAVTPKPRPIIPKLPVRTPKAPPVRTKPPASSTGEVLYATIQPHPMPKAKPVPPVVPAVPTHKPPQHRHEGKQETKPKEYTSSASDEDPDSDYCNWRQEAEASKGSPDLEELYSKVMPLRDRRHNKEVSQDQAKPGQNSPLVNSEIQANFKQVLSNVLLKDLARIPPPCPPRSYGGSSDQLAKLDMEVDDVDYSEIKI